MDVLELAAAFLITSLVALGATRICLAVFVRHHPNWKKKAQKTERIDGDKR